MSQNIIRSMANPFIFEAWLDTVGFANEAARIETEALLRRSEFTTRESLLRFDVELHAPVNIPDGRKAALRTAIAMLQAEAGMSCAVSSNFPFLFLHYPNNNSSTFSVSIPIATSFRRPFHHNPMHLLSLSHTTPVFRFHCLTTTFHCPQQLSS